MSANQKDRVFQMDPGAPRPFDQGSLMNQSMNFGHGGINNPGPGGLPAQPGKGMSATGSFMNAPPDTSNNAHATPDIQ